MESFIHTKKNALSPELCNSLIKQYDNSPSLINPAVFNEGKTHNKAYCDSMDISIRPELLEDREWSPILTQLYIILEQEKENYKSKYLGLSSVATLSRVPECVLIKYEPKGGHHVWHCERGSPHNRNRVLTWMCYLNDVTDRGGTAFYHQKEYINAEQGKLVMWSSEWMHLHKGLASPTQQKYIITGWFEFDLSKYNIEKL